MIISYELLYADPVKKRDLRRVTVLIKSLSCHRKFTNEELLESMRTNQYFVARDERGGIVAVGVLVLTILPGLKSARYEDVVVDKAYRGKGVIDGLDEKMTWYAKAIGCHAIDPGFDF